MSIKTFKQHLNEGLGAAVKRAEKNRQRVLKKAVAARKKGMSDKEIINKFDLLPFEMKKLDELTK